MPARVSFPVFEQSKRTRNGLNISERVTRAMIESGMTRGKDYSLALDRTTRMLAILRLSSMETDDHLFGLGKNRPFIVKRKR